MRRPSVPVVRLAATTRSASLEASCFNISAVTSRYVRLFLGAGATAGWIGVGEVGFMVDGGGDNETKDTDIIEDSIVDGD